MNKKKKVKAQRKIKILYAVAGSRGGFTCDAGYPGFAIDVESRISGILFYCRLLGSDVCSDAALPSVCSP